MPVSTINNRLKELSEFFDSGNITAFSKRLGFKEPAKINRLIRVEGTTPSFAVLETIALKLPNVNLRWLITGSGEMLTTGSYQVKEDGDNYDNYALLVEENVLLKKEKLQLEGMNEIRDQLIKNKDAQLLRLHRKVVGYQNTGDTKK